MAEPTRDERTVLLVEDDVECSRLLVPVLQEVVSRVETADNIEDAQGKVLDEDYDLFVMDVILPYTAQNAQAVRELEEKRYDILASGILGTPDNYLGPKTTQEVRAHFSVLALDDQIADQLNERGGVDLLMHYCRLKAGLDAQASQFPLCEVPIIFLTARELPNLEKEAMSYAAKGKGRWLVKPQTKQAILACVRSLLPR